GAWQRGGREDHGGLAAAAERLVPDRRLRGRAARHLPHGDAQRHHARTARRAPRGDGDPRRGPDRAARAVPPRAVQNVAVAIDDSTASPEHSRSVTELEASVVARLRELAIGYTRHEHPAAATVEEAEPHWAEIDATHCKNLFLRNQKGDRHYLVVLEASKKADLRAVAVPSQHQHRDVHGRDGRLHAFSRSLRQPSAARDRVGASGWGPGAGAGSTGVTYPVTPPYYTGLMKQEPVA